VGLGGVGSGRGGPGPGGGGLGSGAGGAGVSFIPVRISVGCYPLRRPWTALRRG